MHKWPEIEAIFLPLYDDKNSLLILTACTTWPHIYTILLPHREKGSGLDWESQTSSTPGQSWRLLFDHFICRSYGREISIHTHSDST